MLRGQAFNKRYPAARATSHAAFEAAKRPWQVHHRVGLEYAHLYPDVDINSVDNLVGLDGVVHSRVSALWTSFRAKFPANSVTTKQIDEMAGIIDKKFGQFYHKAGAPNASDLSKAEDAARNLLEAIK